MALMSSAEVMSQLVTIQNGLAAIQQNPGMQNVAMLLVNMQGATLETMKQIIKAVDNQTESAKGDGGGSKKPISEHRCLQSMGVLDSDKTSSRNGMISSSTR